MLQNLLGIKSSLVPRPFSLLTKSLGVRLELKLCYQKYLWCLCQQQNGETALTFACKKEGLRSVELLLKAGADPNHMTKVSSAGKQYLLEFLNF